MSRESPIDTIAAAGRLGVTASFLRKLRRLGGGPPFYRIGSLVRYDPADLDEWLAAQRRAPASERSSG